LTTRVPSIDASASSPVAMAMICFAVLTAEYVAGKAARDALYLAQLDVTTLPAMVIATSVTSILLVAASAKLTARVVPSIYVPMLFTVSAALLVGEWLLTFTSGPVAAVLVYLHISGFGPLLGSAFWLIASDRFDPRTAKRRFGQIQGAGTLGGLLGGGVAYEVAAVLGVRSMLLILAVLNLACAALVRRLVGPPHRSGRVAPPASGIPSPRSAPEAPTRTGLRVLATAPYLRMLAALVMLGTASAALLDYVFKVEARSIVQGDGLLRFFSIYYAAASLVTFVLQAAASNFALARFGLALTAATPSLAVVAGSIGGLVAPGIRTLSVARGAETVLRGSFFRAGYEVFYTPIPSAEKRAVKPIIDVAFDRLGDAVGGGAVQLVLLLMPARQRVIILSLAAACSAVAVAVARGLNQAYVQTLERSLVNRAVELDLSDIEDLTTRTVMLRTLKSLRAAAPTRRTAIDQAASAFPTDEDAEVQDIKRLRSRDRDQVTKVLHRDEGLAPSLVPHVIPLLAWDAVAADAVFALRKVAEERVGELVDALIDPNQDFAVRRRLARVFSVCVSQRAADGMLLGLDDLRFEVRFQCGRSLASIVDKNPLIRIDRDVILAVVAREVTVGRMVWESRRLLDALETDEAPSFVDEFVRDRAGQSLTHVFTLLALVLPREPLQIAFRGLHAGDPHLKGTALEYLEAVLPGPIRERLWPFLEDRQPASRPVRPREEILADLVRSHESMLINIEELRRAAAGRAQGKESGPAAAPSDGVKIETKG
jgi:ATP:ADP antiporter, AAA family